MKIGQKGTKYDRVKETGIVHLWGGRHIEVATSFYTPKEFHELQMPSYTKLNKRVKK